MFTNYSPSRHASAGSLPKEDVYARLSKPSRKLRSLAPSSRKISLTNPGRVSPAKLSSLETLYDLIYNADAVFFEESNFENPKFVQKTPLSAADLLSSEKGGKISVYERGEIMRSSQLYYVPSSQRKPRADIDIKSFKDNYGFDDADGNYFIKPHDHIEYRYEIVRTLGTGSFGNVVLCRDHKYSAHGQLRSVAVKIIKNKLDWSLQAVSEIKMLKHLMASRKNLPNDSIMTYCDHFHFRGHMCIVSEVLSINLFTFLELDKFRGLSLELVKMFAHKILKGLDFLHHNKVIHCDIKPENIMLKLPLNYTPGMEAPDFQVKLIDFGSSCFESETSFSYIQSRFYRAPEVILGAKYGPEIDIWSFGCVVAELFTGTPFFPGKSELEQIALILEMLGPPPSTHIIAERKRLVRSIRGSAHKNLNDPLVTDPAAYPKKLLPVDEKKLQKTLLYTLFNLEGKVNTPMLNLQLQSAESRNPPQTASPFKRSVKLNSRSLDVSMRLLSLGEERLDQLQFLKFMSSLFQWEPSARPKPAQLMECAFLQG